jgi:RNA polymerase sigma factor (sigma-70 family)
MQADDLLSKMWLRLIESRKKEWNNREHFFRYAAITMKNILVNGVRGRAGNERKTPHRPLDDAERLSKDTPSQSETLERKEALEMLSNALDELSRRAPCAMKVISLSLAEQNTAQIARALEMSESGVRRERERAHEWLRRYLRRQAESSIRKYS